MSKIILPLFAVLLVACTSSEPEQVTTSVDVDEPNVAALLRDIDGLADNSLPVDRMLELAVSTPMDEEQQERYAFRFKGSDEEIQFHVWREQVDWLHLYFSSTSKELVAAIAKVNEGHARPDGS